MTTHPDDPVLARSGLSAFEVQNSVEMVAWQNRKIFARRRRQPWIADLAFAAAIDAYLLGLEHGARGRLNHAEVERHLKELKDDLVKHHPARGRDGAAQKAPVRS